MSAHSCLLKLEDSQVISPPLPQESTSPDSMPFCLFASFNDFIVTNVLIEDWISAESIDQLLSTYPLGHLAFHNHKDLFHTVYQASQAAPTVICAFMNPFISC